MFNNNSSFNFQDFYEKLLKLNTNSLSILSKLTESLTSTDEYIDITIWDEKQSSQITYRIPSYGFLKQKMFDLDRNFNLLTNAKNQQVAEINETLLDQRNFVEPYLNTPLSIERYALAKPNLIIQNLKNIDIQIVIDASNKISNLCKEVEYLLINFKNLNSQASSDIETLISRNDLSLPVVIDTLKRLNIEYQITKDIYRFEPTILDKSGNFIILNEGLSDNDILPDGRNIEYTDVSGTAKWYQLDKSYYYLNTNSHSVSGLQIGDMLCKNRVFFYQVKDIYISNITQNIYVQLLNVNTEKNASLKTTDVLSVSSAPIINKKLHIPCSPFEKKILFIKELTPNLNLTSYEYGSGIGIDGSKMMILNEKGVEVSLKDFYLKNIYEYAEYFESLKSEMKITNMYGIQPDAPILLSTNLKVVSINDHKVETGGNEEAAKLVADLSYKVSLRNSLIQSQTNNITKRKSLLDSGLPETSPEIINIDNNLLTIEETLISVNKEITDINVKLSQLNITVNDDYSPKYRIRGFWEFPKPKIDIKGRKQDVIAFDIQYRYLSIFEVPNCNARINFNSLDGSTKDVIFSEWVSLTSSTRAKVLNENTGRYVWEYEDITELVPNVNQLDIPITANEKVEIRVRSISEAGYPENPMKSEWSESIIIEFPIEYLTIATENIQLDEAITRAKTDYNTLQTIQTLQKQMELLENKINKQVKTGINFEYYYVNEYIKETGRIDIPNLSDIKDNMIFINLEQGSVMNPTVDFHYNVTDQVSYIGLSPAYLAGMNINDKLLLIYSN